LRSLDYVLTGGWWVACNPASRRLRTASCVHNPLDAARRSSVERDPRFAADLVWATGSPTATRGSHDISGCAEERKVIKIGFVGAGWIGRNRMEAMLATGKAEPIAIFDEDPERAAEAARLAPGAWLVGSFEELLALRPDGVAIATPSALHSEQCIYALDSGAAVFCQKPLGRNATEVAAVLDTARLGDRLLGVDLSYRHTAAMQAIREQVREGALGKIFAADLVFHNAYGPQSRWFWNPQLSGGGCLIDLGTHLVDLALWLLDFPAMEQARGRQYRQGRVPNVNEVEDYAAGSFDLVDGTNVRIACSWNLSCGTDAVIRATFHGTEGSAEMRNEKPSYSNFTAELFKGRERRMLASPPDDWPGRAAAEWVEKLARGEGFTSSTEGLLESARVLDRVYGRDTADQLNPAAFLRV
jgi:predicted dehydrogenase